MNCYTVVHFRMFFLRNIFCFSFYLLFHLVAGVYFRRAAKSCGDSHHPHLLPEEEIPGDH